MPRSCSVPGCSSNSGWRKKIKDAPEKKQYISVFQFPKEPNIREKWIRAIRRKDWKPLPQSGVCILHFAEQFVIREDRMRRDDGTFLVVKRSHLKLTDCAYPTIFPNQPKYMTKTLPSKRKTPAERAEEVNYRISVQEKERKLNNTIHSFAEFTEKHEAKYQNSSYITVNKRESILFVKVNTDLICPQVYLSVEVLSDLTVRVTNKGAVVPQNSFKAILGRTHLCNEWSKFCDLMKHLDVSPDVELLSVYDNIEQASTILQNAMSTLDNADNINDSDIILKDKLAFLQEQLNLSTMSQKRYSPELIMWACTVFFGYPAAYRLIRECKLLSLPHPKYLSRA